MKAGLYKQTYIYVNLQRAPAKHTHTNRRSDTGPHVADINKKTSKEPYTCEIRPIQRELDTGPIQRDLDT